MTKAAYVQLAYIAALMHVRPTGVLRVRCEKHDFIKNIFKPIINEFIYIKES